MKKQNLRVSPKFPKVFKTFNLILPFISWGLVLICFLLLGTGQLFCQSVGINTTGSTPDASAMLDVSSTNTGLLIPRVSLTSTTDVVTIASPATSLLVYNTNAAMTGGAVGYWYWDGAQWAQIGAGGGSGWLLTGNAGTIPGTNFIGTTDAQDWVIKTNNAERMRILSGGNIGVGLTAPASQLHSAGQIRTGIPGGGLGGAAATTGSLLFYNSINTNTINIQSGTTSAGYTLTLPTAAPPVNNYALVGSTSGVLSWADPNPTPICLLGDDNSAGLIDACTFVTGTTWPEGQLIFSTHNEDWSWTHTNGNTEKLIIKSVPDDPFKWYTTTDLIIRGMDVWNSPTQSEDAAGIRGEIISAFSVPIRSALSFSTRTGGGALTERMRINDVGNVGIGTAAPAYKLQLSTNSAAKPTSTAWTVPSDERLKRDIRPFTQGLDAVKQINPIWFKYNGKGGISPEEGGVGAMAQDIEKIAPYMIKPFQYTDTVSGATTTYMGVDYGALDFILVNAIKEQQKIIDSQQSAIGSLQTENKNMKSENISMQSDIQKLKSVVEKLMQQEPSALKEK